MTKLKFANIMLTDAARVSSISRKFGQYTCIELALQEDSWQYSPFYWRLIDNKFSLIEVGLHPSTGQLLSLTVTMYNGIIESKVPMRANQDEAVTETIGIPRFSLDLWKIVRQGDFSQRFHNVTGRCQLSLMNDNLIVSLFPDVIVSSIIISELLSCELNSERELSAFTIYNLNSQEILALRKYEELHSSRNQAVK